MFQVRTSSKRDCVHEFPVVRRVWHLIFEDVLSTTFAHSNSNYLLSQIGFFGHGAQGAVFASNNFTFSICSINRPTLITFTSKSFLEIFHYVLDRGKQGRGGGFERQSRSDKNNTSMKEIYNVFNQTIVCFI